MSNCLSSTLALLPDVRATVLLDVGNRTTSILHVLICAL
jgi:hypothetical protein